LIINPNDPELLLAIGSWHFGGGGTYDIETAKEYFLRASQLQYENYQIHYQLGRIYFIQGKFRLALHNIKEVMRINPDFKKGYYMYGLINGYSGNIEQAIWGFEEFIRRDDFNWAGYNDLAWIYFQKGDYKKTSEIAQKGLEKAEVNPWLHNIYGTALLNLGSTEKARNEFQMALRYSERMTPAEWGGAYPGNNPKEYERGLTEMRTAIKHNFSLTENK
jgi:tetratricopeptide (TPR) repeat protein